MGGQLDREKTYRDNTCRENITVEEAIACMTGSVTEIRDMERVPLGESLGRILAEDMTAAEDNPPFDRSPIDGYACRAADTAGASREHPVRLTVIEEVDAGQASQCRVEQGQAVRIMTGAAIPAGCDCCLRQENTDYGEETVAVYEEMSPHDNYCDRGEDFRAGTRLCAKGEKLGYVELGILAGMGCNRVPVRRKPRIALLTTGDEVVQPGLPLAPGKIYDSNQYLLTARLTQWGLKPLWVQSVGDDAKAVGDAIRRTAEAGADLILTTGGVSVGKKDILHGALAYIGAGKIFWRVRLKPGTPTIFSLYRGIPVVSLSGNPFGAAANLELLVRPMLAKLTGDDSLSVPVVSGILDGVFPKASHGRRFIRASYKDGHVSLPDGLHSSGVLSSMKGCNCLVDIPPGTPFLQKGDTVRVWLLGERIG